MFHIAEKAVFGMAGLRIISSLIEMTGAFLMLYFGTTSKALQVNAALALVGPTVLVLVTMIGVTGLAGERGFGKVIWIVIGVACILYGARR